MDDLAQHNEAGAKPAAASSQPAPVTLVKGRHRWTFACDAGSEALLLRHLSELARCEEVPFDYFDAALVSHQISRRLKPGLFRIEMEEVEPRPVA